MYVCDSPVRTCWMNESFFVSFGSFNEWTERIDSENDFFLNEFRLIRPVWTVCSVHWNCLLDLEPWTWTSWMRWGWVNYQQKCFFTNEKLNIGHPLNVFTFWMHQNVKLISWQNFHIWALFTVSVYESVRPSNSVPNDWNDSSIHLNFDKATLPSIKH